MNTNYQWIPLMIKHATNDNCFFNEENLLLDLGFGRLAEKLFGFYKIYKKEFKYYGVDSGGEEFWNYHTLPQSIDEYKKKFSLEDLMYQHFYKEYEKIERSEFDKIFNLKFMDGLDYLNLCPVNKFDLVINSNFTHFFTPKKSAIEILNKSIKVLKPKGLLYLNIANEYHNYANDPNKTIFKREDLINIFSKHKIIMKIETEGHNEFLIEKRYN